MDKTNDKLSYGIVIIIFGVLFLLDKTGILKHLPFGSELISVGSFLLIGGIVFLITQPRKTLGWVLTILGVILNADTFFGWMQNYSKYMIPVAVIVVGVFLVVSSKAKRK